MTNYFIKDQGDETAPAHRVPGAGGNDVRRAPPAGLAIAASGVEPKTRDLPTVGAGTGAHEYTADQVTSSGSDSRNADPAASRALPGTARDVPGNGRKGK